MDHKNRYPINNKVEELKNTLPHSQNHSQNHNHNNNLFNQHKKYIYHQTQRSHSNNNNQTHKSINNFQRNSHVISHHLANNNAYIKNQKSHLKLNSLNNSATVAVGIQQIYFDNKKKSIYMKDIVDKYFQDKYLNQSSGRDHSNSNEKSYFQNKNMNMMANINMDKYASGLSQVQKNLQSNYNNNSKNKSFSMYNHSSTGNTFKIPVINQNFQKIQNKNKKGIQFQLEIGQSSRKKNSNRNSGSFYQSSNDFFDNQNHQKDNNKNNNSYSYRRKGNLDDLSSKQKKQRQKKQRGEISQRLPQKGLQSSSNIYPNLQNSHMNINTSLNISNNSSPYQNTDLLQLSTPQILSQSTLINHSNFSNSFLPPIHQMNDLQEDFNMDLPSYSSNNLLSVVEIEQQQKKFQNLNKKQIKIPIFQNAAFIVFICINNNKQQKDSSSTTTNKKSHYKYRIKQYKAQGIQLLKRQKRIIQRFQSQIVNIWKQSKYNQFALMSSMIPPIKDLLFKISSDWENKSIVYKIAPRSYQKYLMNKNAQELMNFIRDMVALLKKIQGKVLNNKINLSNIFLIDSKPCLAEWGQSSFRQVSNIQENTFQSRIDPILRTQFQWFATPQYLSPQILLQIVKTKDEKNINKSKKKINQGSSQQLQKLQIDQNQEDDDIWEYPSSSDIWSLGLTIFEIATSIPVWSPIKCIVKNKVKLGRIGILGTQNRNIQKIIQKQKKIQKTVKKCLLAQLHSEQLNQKLIKLILKMLEYQPKKRINLDGILQILQER